VWDLVGTYLIEKVEVSNIVFFGVNEFVDGFLPLHFLGGRLL